MALELVVLAPVPLHVLDQRRFSDKRSIAVATLELLPNIERQLVSAHVVFVAGGAFEFLAANVAGENHLGPAALMLADFMLAELQLRRVLGIAPVALERFFVGVVAADVDLAVLLDQEALAAVIADVRPVLFVFAHVQRQRAFDGEFSVADVALEGALLGVHRAHVLQH